MQTTDIVHTRIKNCPAATNTMFVHFSNVLGDKYVHNQAYTIDESDLFLKTFTDARKQSGIQKDSYKNYRRRNNSKQNEGLGLFKYFVM